MVSVQVLNPASAGWRSGGQGWSRSMLRILATSTRGGHRNHAGEEGSLLDPRLRRHDHRYRARSGSRTLFRVVGFQSEGIRWLDGVLGATSEATPHRARALTRAVHLARWRDGPDRGHVESICVVPAACLPGAWLRAVDVHVEALVGQRRILEQPEKRIGAGWRGRLSIPPLTRMITRSSPRARSIGGTQEIPLRQDAFSDAKRVPAPARRRQP